MKLSFCLFGLLLCLSLTNYGQTKQRMALLPSSLNYGADPSIKSLCIDALRAGPSSGDQYSSVLHSAEEDRGWVSKLGSSYSIEGRFGHEAMNVKVKDGTLVRPSNIKQAIIVGMEPEDIPARYIQFINQEVKKLSNTPLNWSTHNTLQEKIWAYNVLDILGYLSGNGSVTQDFEQGSQKFISDFNAKEDLAGELMKLGKDLNLYSKQNEAHSDDYVAVFVRKSDQDGTYVVFDGAQKYIYRGRDELAIANILEARFDKFDNVHLFLENFESEEKEAAFLSTLRIALRSKDKMLGITQRPMTDVSILLNKANNLKLEKSISADDIIPVVYDNKEYFGVSFKVEEVSGYSSSAQLDALSSKKNILQSFIDRTNKFFNQVSDQITLKGFLNSFKRNIKQMKQIESDDEFVIVIKSQFKSVRIVKIAGEDHAVIIVVQN